MPWTLDPALLRRFQRIFKVSLPSPMQRGQILKNELKNCLVEKTVALEEIVEKMESGDLHLDDSLKLFEEGVKLSRDCNSERDKAEQKVKLLLNVDESGNTTEKDFEIPNE